MEGGQGIPSPVRCRNVGLRKAAIAPLLASLLESRWHRMHRSNYTDDRRWCRVDRYGVGAMICHPGVGLRWDVCLSFDVHATEEEGGRQFVERRQW